MRLGQCLPILAFAVASASAAVIGVSTPAPSITADRIATLPRAQQAAWGAYLDRSTRQSRADRAFLDAELKTASLPPRAPRPAQQQLCPQHPFESPARVVRHARCLRIADIIVSFQTPAGGWSKNLNLADHLRRPGESFAPNNLSAHLSPGDFDTPHDPQWNYVGTLDNDATTTELQFLAKVAAAAPPPPSPIRPPSFAASNTSSPPNFPMEAGRKSGPSKAAITTPSPLTMEPLP